MSPITLPQPRMDGQVEQELLRLLEKGFSANQWRPDFEEWKQKRIWAERHQGRLVRVLERYAVPNGSFQGLHTLDLGSGRGGLSLVLTAGGARVTAVDLRRRNGRILGLRASRYGMSIPFAVAVGEHLPFAEAQFDLVVCKDVTEHCRDPRRLLSEIRRVLVPGGRAYVTFINRLAWVDPHYKIAGVNFLPRILAEWVIGRAGRAKPNIRDLQRLSDMHYYTLRGARKLANLQGFEYEDITLRELIAEGEPRMRRIAYQRLSLGAGTLEAVLTRR